jgi:hypothetical protein
LTSLPSVAVALRQQQAQEIAAAGDGRDLLAGENDGAARGGDTQNTPGRRRKDLALARLLLDDVKLGLRGRHLVGEHLDLGSRLVEPALRGGGAGEKLLGPL